MGLLQKAIQISHSQEKNQALLNEVDNQILTKDEWSEETEAELSNTIENNVDLSQNYHSHSQPNCLTKPDKHPIFYEERLHALQNILDYIKELNNIESEDDFWNSTLYSMMIQLGVEKICILIKEEENYYIKAAQGFEIEKDTILPVQTKLYNFLNTNTEIQYIQNILSYFKGKEKKWLLSLDFYLLVPIKYEKKIYGFFLMGKPLHTFEYTLDNFFYLVQFTEIFITLYKSIQDIIESKVKLKSVQTFQRRTELFTELLKKINTTSEPKQVTDFFYHFIEKEFNLKSYCLLIKDGYQFISVLSNHIKDKSISSLKFSSHSPWLWDIRRSESWDTNLSKKKSCFNTVFTSEELEVIKNIYCFPIKFEKILYGMFIVFDTEGIYTLEELHSLEKFIHNIFNYFLIKQVLKQKSVDTLNDPLFSFRYEILDKEKELEDSGVPYTLIFIKIDNRQSLANILDDEQYNILKEQVYEILKDAISENDYIAQIFQGQYLVSVKGYNKKRSESFIHYIKGEVSKKFNRKSYQPVLWFNTLNRPHDEMIPIEDFIFKHNND